MRSLALTLIFVLSSAIGLCLYDKLTLPFSNPWNLKGPLAALEYNPNNDIVRFLFLVALPSVVFIFCFFNKFIGNLCIGKAHHSNYGLKKSTNERGLTKALVCILVLASVSLMGGNTYRLRQLDTFHEGESLGPAIDYLHGKIPYRDTIFIHGAFQDPLRSVLAFEIFGQSIASLRTLQSLLALPTLLLFIAASYFLYYNNIYYTTISTFSLIILGYVRPFGAVFHLTYTEMPLLTFIIVSVLIQRAIKDGSCRGDRTKTSILVFLFTFIPAATLAVSVDKALFLCATSIMFSVAAYLLYLRQIDPKYIFPILGGYAMGIAVLGLAIKWAYVDFVTFIVVLVNLDPMLNGLIYPFKQIEFLLPVLFVSAVFYWLIYRFASYVRQTEGSVMDKVKRFYARYFVEILLAMLCIFYFRKALGRSDLQHLAGVLPILLISITYIVLKHYVSPLLERTKNGRRMLSTAAVGILAVFVVTFPMRISWAHWYKLPLGVPDAAFIPENYHETIFFLKENLAADEQFLTLTSEASWYYFLNKPCPVRFSVIYHAMPHFYQTEIVQDLRRRNVKFILYRNNHWANATDGFDVEARLPIVVEYIKQNYGFFKMIDDNEIWIRNPGHSVT